MIKNKKFKKVLIIGQGFNNNTGYGVTLTNLFSGWPNDKIALATYGESMKNISFNKVKNVYLIGKDEVNVSFPFSLFKKSFKSGPIKQNSTQIKEAKNLSKKNSPLRLFFLKTVFLFIRKSGIYNFAEKLILSKKFEDWIIDIKPDIIYTQIGSLISINFFTDVVNKFKIPIIVHIMDDWPLTIPGYFGWLYKRKLHNSIKQFFSICSSHMAISEDMAQEYARRYGHNWTAFQNCIDFDFWNKPNLKKSEYLKENKFTILYAGRIGTGTSTSLLEVAESIEDLFKEGYNISFKIQTNVPDHPIMKHLTKLNSVQFLDRVPYKELPNRFASVNLLVLPIDFDMGGYTYLKYSLPTKVPEYMASGTTILVYSPKGTALTNFANNNNVAVIVNERNRAKITSSIKYLINNPKSALSLSERAVTYAKTNQDCRVVQENFYKTILKTIKYANNKI